MTKLEPWDLVRVKQMDGTLSPTVYEIVTIYNDGLRCLIREISFRKRGRPRKPQAIDTSLLVLAKGD